MTSVLERLGSTDGLPVDAISAANADRVALVPVFLDLIAPGTKLDATAQKAIFFVFHLLGQWREQSAYRPLAAFLRRPTDEIEQLLGEAVTATSHRVMASVFDGDPAPLYAVILDPDANEFVRSRLCEALAMVTLRGELARAEALRFLKSCHVDLQPQGVNFVWDGWQSAIALLGLSELAPLVEQAFARGFIDPHWLGLEDFQQDLRRSIAGEPLSSWRKADQFELFGDTIEELATWAAFAPKRANAGDVDDVWTPSWDRPPAVNPFKGIGRNDPCPCGSGRKFKKCCLGKSQAEWPDIDPALDVDPPRAPPPTSVPVVGRTDTAAPVYDPLVEPRAPQWLAMGEQERIDLVEAYHRQIGVEIPAETVHAIIHVIVENQIAMGDQLPVGRVARRLMSEGLDRHDAIHAIGSVLIMHVNNLMTEADSGSLPGAEPSDPAANNVYFAALDRLAADDWLRSAESP